MNQEIGFRLGIKLFSGHLWNTGAIYAEAHGGVMTLQSFDEYLTKAGNANGA